MLAVSWLTTTHRGVDQAAAGPGGRWVTTPAETESSMAIGQIIRQVRERKALSQDELALRLRDVAANDGQHPQTTRRTISRWERGTAASILSCAPIYGPIRPGWTGSWR